MQDTVIDRQPPLLAPVIRFALAAAVAAALTAIFAVASSASHTALRTLSAQFQPAAPRHVTLPFVEIVGRREQAADVPEAPSRSAAVATASRVQSS